MGERSRPKAVTVLAILEIIVGALMVFLGFVLGPLGYAPTITEVSYAILLVGLVDVMLGGGMWKGKGWAWMGTLVLSVLVIVACVVYLFSPSLARQVGAGLLEVSILAMVELIVIRTLLQSRTKAYFNR